MEIEFEDEFKQNILENILEFNKNRINQLLKEEKLNFDDFIKVFPFQSENLTNLTEDLKKKHSDLSQEEFKRILSYFRGYFDSLNQSYKGFLSEPFYSHLRVNFQLFPEDLKIKFCESFIQKQQFTFLNSLLDLIEKIDIKQLFKNNYSILDKIPNEIEYLSKKIFEKLYAAVKKDFIPRIILKSITIPKNDHFPSGTISNLDNYSVFIGKNNQKKTRLLNLISKILWLIKFKSTYNSVLPNGDYIEPDIIECLNKGVSIEIKVQKPIVNFSKKIWGWDVPKVTLEEESFSLFTNNNRIIAKPNVNWQNFQTHLQYSKQTLISEYFQLPNLEKMFDDGFEEMANKFDKGQLQFTEIFRRLLYYYHELDSIRGEIFHFNIFFDEIKDCWGLFRRFFLKAQIEAIFQLKGNFPEYFERNFDEIIYRGKNLLSKYKINLDLNFDFSKNLFLLECSAKKDIRDIKDQGHGIRKLVLILASQFFTQNLFLDEPENGLHIELQKDIRDVLIMNRNIQTITTTHSPNFIQIADNVKVFTLEKNKIIPKAIFPNSIIEIQKSQKNFAHIRKIIGLSPETLLFSKVNLVLEGRDDRKGFFAILRNFHINPLYISGKSSMFTLMKQFEKIQNHFSIKVCYLFDLDYFNHRIYTSEKSKIFFLPCYSFENLLVDPYFLSDIFDLELDFVSKSCNSIIQDKKQETLEHILLHGIFKNNIPSVIKQKIKKIKLDWSVSCLESINNLVKNTFLEILKENIQTIKEMKKINTKLRTTTLNHLFLLQTYDSNYKSALEDTLNRKKLDWDGDVTKFLEEIILGVINSQEIEEIVQEIKQIDLNWRKDGLKYIELKSWLKEFLNSVYSKMNILPDSRLSINELRRKYYTFLTQKDVENGITKQMKEIIKGISTL